MHQSVLAALGTCCAGRLITLPDFGALGAMLLYVDEFSEKLHDPKESRLLFLQLRGQGAHSDAMLDRLERDHAGGEHGPSLTAHS